jgi:hypothetical protein
MPCIILRPAHGLDKLISHLGVCHYITKTHLGGQDTLHNLARALLRDILHKFI